MIRVLHLIDSLDLGGAQTVILNYLRHFDRQRIHIEVACLHGRGVFFEQLLAQDVPVHSLSPEKWPPHYLRALPELLCRGNFDILHSHLTASNWIGKPIAAALGVRKIINHDHCNDRSWQRQPATVLADTLLNALSSEILAVSRSTETFLREIEALPVEKVRYFPNPVDCDYFQPATPEEKKEARRFFGLAEEGVIIGGAGRFTAQKNFQLFVRAAANNQLPNTQWILAGQGPEEQQLKSLAREVGAPLHFPGFISDMRRFYAAIDILCVTSLFEGMPMNILEAMACGIPVAAPAVDGCLELIEDGVDGRLFAVDNLPACRRALRDLTLANLSTLGNNARRKTTESYSAHDYAKKLDAIYLESD